MKEHDCGLIESKVFPGPYVRVRGRVSREGQVRWSPALRVEKGSGGSDQPAPGRGPNSPRVRALAVNNNQYWVDFLDYNGKVLVSGPSAVRFLAKEQEEVPFVARLPYHDQTLSIRLRLGERELGRTGVPTDRPCFTLMSPGEDACINPSGVLHLRWCPHDSEYPMTFYVRYSHDSKTWARPGVNLKGNDYYLDLREMPGGKRCVVQVLATNGYRTSYVQTRYFEVPVKPPEVLVGESTGPVLFAQGFSLQDGALSGDNVVWLIDGSSSRSGGSLDTRTLGPGIHQVSVQVRDFAGGQRTSLLGSYDSKTGLRIGPKPL